MILMVKIYLLDLLPLYEEDSYQKAFTQIDMARQEKVLRLRNKLDKCQCVGGGLLIQYALKEYLGCREESVIQKIRYAYAKLGKSSLLDYPDFHFNLSHTGSLAVLAVSKDEVGIDIQRLVPVLSDRVAKRFFSRTEVDLLSNTVGELEKRALFFRIWTAKESYIKLTGQGISQGLNTFSVDFYNGRIIDPHSTFKAYIKEESIVGLGFECNMTVCSRQKDFLVPEVVKEWIQIK